MSPARQERTIRFSGHQREGTSELARRFQSQESISEADITEIAQSFLRNLKADTVGLDSANTIYVVSSLLDQTIKRLAHLELLRDEAVDSALERLRIAVGEKLLQLVNADNTLIAPEQIYLLQQVVSRNKHEGVDNVWSARHTNGEAIVKYDVTGLRSESQKAAYQQIVALLAEHPHPNLKALTDHYDLDYRIAIGEQLKFETLDQWLKQPEQHPLVAALRTVRSVLDGALYLQQHEIAVMDMKAENIGIDAVTHTPFIFDFGVAAPLKHPDVHPPAVLREQVAEYGRTLDQIYRAYFKADLLPAATNNLHTLVLEAMHYSVSDLNTLATRLDQVIAELA